MPTFEQAIRPGMPEFLNILAERKEGELLGKVAIITGASRGIGAASARLFAELGAHVVINSRPGKIDVAQGFVNELIEIGKPYGTNAIWVQGDIAIPKTAQDLVERTVNQFGRIDILVNNAGMRKDGSFWLMSDENIHQVFEANFFGAVRLTRGAAKQMRRQNPQGGSIIFISSIAAEGNLGQANYAPSKAAVNAYVKSIWEECARYGIRVNTIAPGLVDTDMTNSLHADTVAEILTATKSQRALTAEEIADYIEFLASDRSSKINGEIISILGPQK